MGKTSHEIPSGIRVHARIYPSNTFTVGGGRPKNSHSVPCPDSRHRDAALDIVATLEDKDEYGSGRDPFYRWKIRYPGSRADLPELFRFIISHAIHRLLVRHGFSTYEIGVAREEAIPIPQNFCLDETEFPPLRNTPVSVRIVQSRGYVGHLLIEIYKIERP